MLKPGDSAPTFSLQDQDGQAVTLEGLLEDGDLIVYFYPADFSPVCTAEACMFRDVHDDLSDVDIQIVGISPQSSASHARFANSFSLPFPILSDPRKEAIRAFGVSGPLGMGVRRATFLIDQEGVVLRRVVSDLMVNSHANFIRQVIRGES